jgi:D-alanine-D-alanine ligase
MHGRFTQRRVGVLMGGPSAEREVSLSTGKGVTEALLERGYQTIAIDWLPGEDLAKRLRDARVEVVWNALHGTYGEDGAVQGLLECLRIPYTGSGVLASAIAMDKTLSKRIFEQAGVPTAPWSIVPEGEPGAALVRARAAEWGYPVVIKPSREGSSVGVSIVHGPDELDEALHLARRHHGDVLCERFIAGAEIDVGVLGDIVLGTVEIRPATEFYTYEAKYQRSDTQYLVPAPASVEVLARLGELALESCRLFACSGVVRVDTRVDAQGDVFVLEVNTLPGMTPTSLVPKLARHAGISYAEVCERVLDAARLHLG